MQEFELEFDVVFKHRAKIQAETVEEALEKAKSNKENYFEFFGTRYLQFSSVTGVFAVAPAEAS